MSYLITYFKYLFSFQSPLKPHSDNQKSSQNIHSIRIHTGQHPILDMMSDIDRVPKISRQPECDNPSFEKITGINWNFIAVDL